MSRCGLLARAARGAAPVHRAPAPLIYPVNEASCWISCRRARDPWFPIPGVCAERRRIGAWQRGVGESETPSNWLPILTKRNMWLDLTDVCVGLVYDQVMFLNILFVRSNKAFPHYAYSAHRSTKWFSVIEDVMGFFFEIYVQKAKTKSHWVKSIFFSTFSIISQNFIEVIWVITFLFFYLSGPCMFNQIACNFTYSTTYKKSYHRETFAITNTINHAKQCNA